MRLRLFYFQYILRLVYFHFFLIAITMAIALIVFLTENEWANKLSYRYSWTFILGWIAVLLSLLSAIWATMMGRFDAS